MRMNKIIFLAAVAVAVAACSKTYDAKPVSEQEIGFKTWNETLTKAHDPSGSSFAENDNFNVYGFKTLSSGNVDVFEGTVVTNGATAWTYAPLRFWDPDATSYTFYAVSPAGLLDGTGASATTAGVFTSEAITFDGKTDILVANKTNVTTKTSPVTLPFTHIASLLDLKVKKTDDLEYASEDANNYIKVAITSISLTNIDGAGTFTVSAYAEASPYAPTLSSSTWTSSGSTGYTTYTNTSGYTEVTLPDDINTSTVGANDLISKLVVMPQEFRTDGSADQTVTIAYTITVADNGNTTATNYTSSFDLKEFDDSDDTANNGTLVASWAPNTHYTYTITIGANAITFTASINDWSTNTGYHYLIN